MTILQTLRSSREVDIEVDVNRPSDLRALELEPEPEPEEQHIVRSIN